MLYNLKNMLIAKTIIFYVKVKKNTLWITYTVVYIAIKMQKKIVAFIMFTNV